jgi:hypothetical protein
LSIENGSVVGVLLPTNVMLNISNIVELSCVCETIGVNGIATEVFRGVRGALIPGDCGALRFFSKVRDEST